jgi:hypothetical protein
VEVLEPKFFSADVEMLEVDIVNPTPIVLEPMERSVPGGVGVEVLV